MSEEKDFYTIQETAQLLRVSRTQVYRMIEAEQLHPYRHPLFKLGAPVRVPRHEVDALVRRISEERPVYGA